MSIQPHKYSLKSSSVRRDLCVLVAINAVSVWVFATYDAMAGLLGLSPQHAGYAFAQYLPIPVVLCLTLLIFAEQRRQEAAHVREIYQLAAQQDILTGLHNRKFLFDAMSLEYKRYKRERSVFSLVVFDVDDFKVINETKGHDRGDEVLKEIAEYLSATVRGTDLVARWDGQEFMVLCRDTEKSGAGVISEKIREHFQEYIFSGSENITVSLGVAAIDEVASTEALIELADTRMREAKKAGKNRVVCGG